MPIVNRGGAAGAIGNASVARATPDGYTLLMALSSLALLPEAARVNGREPAYTPDSSPPIALFAADPTVLVVPASQPDPHDRGVHRRREGAAGAGRPIPRPATTPRCMCRWRCWRQAAGLDMLHVPFQGGGPALTALLGGQVKCLASGPGPVAPHVRRGRAARHRHLGPHTARRASRTCRR